MELFVGQCAKYSKKISEEDINKFADILGDYNPLHTDEEIAKKMEFSGKIAHGALINALISTAIGVYLPGPGTVYLSQYSSFKKPVYIGDMLTVKVVVDKFLERGKVRLKTSVYNQDDKTVLSGTAYVMLPKKYFD